MKKSYLLFIYAAIAFGCGDKSKYLLNQVPIEPVLNPDTKTLIKDDAISYARLETGNIIRGITNKNYFTTTNGFQDFQYSGYTLPAATITPFNIEKNAFVITSGSAQAPVINYSEDYGKTWGAVAPVLTPAITVTDYYITNLMWVSFIDKENIILLYHQKTYTTGDVRKIYRVNATTGRGTLIASFWDANQPVCARFVNAKTGWMLLYRGTEAKTYITKTMDSGVTWSKLVLVDSKKITNLQTSDKGKLLVYEPYGTATFSTDSGLTWKKPATEINFTHIQMLNPAVSFALANNGLMKSVDSGTTWNTISDGSSYEFSNMKKIHFQDEQNGLMYADKKMYITADGGVSWKTLLYPYPYIVE
jgi:hypothetical protein